MGDLVLFIIVGVVKLTGWFVYWVFTGKEALGWIRLTEAAEYDLLGETGWADDLHDWLKRINDGRRFR